MLRHDQHTIWDIDSLLPLTVLKYKSLFPLWWTNNILCHFQWAYLKRYYVTLTRSYELQLKDQHYVTIFIADNHYKRYQPYVSDTEVGYYYMVLAPHLPASWLPTEQQYIFHNEFKYTAWEVHWSSPSHHSRNIHISFPQRHTKLRYSTTSCRQPHL